MRNKEWSVFRKTIAVILTAALVLISAGCGKGGNAAESALSNEDGSGSVPSGIPEGGKWVDSDVVFTVRSEDNIRFQDDFAAAANKDYTEKNLEDIKSFLIVQTIDSVKYLLDRESYEKMVKLYMNGADNYEGISDSQNSVLFRNDIKICGFLPLLDTLYLEKYYTDDEKIAKINEFTSVLIKAYAQILDEEDWMSEETRTAAKGKLQNMALHLVKPDNIADYSAADIKSYEEGGNLVEAAAEGRRMIETHMAVKSADSNWDRYKWDIYDACCFYHIEVA